MNVHFDNTIRDQATGAVYPDVVLAFSDSRCTPATITDLTVEYDPESQSYTNLRFSGMTPYSVTLTIGPKFFQCTREEKAFSIFSAYMNYSAMVLCQWYNTALSMGPELVCKVEPDLIEIMTDLTAIYFRPQPVIDEKIMEAICSGPGQKSPNCMLCPNCEHKEEIDEEDTKCPICGTVMVPSYSKKGID